MTRRCARNKPGSREIVAARVPPVSTIAEIAEGCRVIGMAWRSASAPRRARDSLRTSCYTITALYQVICSISNGSVLCTMFSWDLRMEHSHA